MKPKGIVAVAAWTLGIGLLLGVLALTVVPLIQNFEPEQHASTLWTWAAVLIWGTIIFLQKRRESPRWRTWTLGFLLFGLAVLIRLAEGQVSELDQFEILTSDVHPAVRAFHWLGLDPIRTLGSLIALGVVAWLGPKFMSPEAKPLYPRVPSYWRRRMGVVIALVVLWPQLLNTVDAIVEIPREIFFGFSWDRWWVVNWIDDFGQFVIPALLLLSSRNEGWITDENGLRFQVFNRWSIIRARWAKIRRVNLIQRGSGSERLVVHYRTKFFLDFAVTIDPAHFHHGQILKDQILQHAEGRVVRFARNAAGIALGWVSIVLGLMCTAASLVSQNVLSMRYANGQITVANFHELAGIPQLTILFIAAIVFISLGFGLHSGASWGGSRMGLLTVWILGVRYLPDPLLHWLVWIAIYSIHAATMTPYEPRVNPTVPPGDQLEMAMTITMMAPILIPIFFWIGVLLGKSKLRQSEDLAKV